MHEKYQVHRKCCKQHWYAPGQLRCLKGHLRLVNLAEISPIHDNEDSRFLALPVDSQKLTQQLNLQMLPKENLLKVDDATTKPAGIGSTWGKEPAVLNW